jgi:hypothetical protein
LTQTDLIANSRIGEMRLTPLGKTKCGEEGNCSRWVR